MRAMVLPVEKGELRLDSDRSPRSAGPEQVTLRVRACGVCRTDLHLQDGELPQAKSPLVLGHEIVGTVTALGPNVDSVRLGTRLGVPWLAHTCGECRYCRSGRENLCDRGEFTGYTRDGGYGDEVVADVRFCLPLPAEVSDAQVAPWLCSGLIGYRALRAAGEAHRLGFYGFGASAHLIAQLAVSEGREVYAFTRPGDAEGQEFARSLGVTWAGGSDVVPPEELDAAILFAPVGALVPTALAATAKGGTVVCAGIHMSDLPSFPYRWLWGERVVRSVANLTRQDAVEFLPKAANVPLRSTVTTFPLERANEALHALRTGQVHGAAVLLP
jgi:propanol-preferring alcohol dehydrogenase